MPECRNARILSHIPTGTLICLLGICTSPTSRLYYQCHIPVLKIHHLSIMNSSPGLLVPLHRPLRKRKGQEASQIDKRVVEKRNRKKIVMIILADHILRKVDKWTTYYASVSSHNRRPLPQRRLFCTTGKAYIP